MGLLVRSVGTYAQLPAASSVPAGTVIQVGNDPTPALNGFYRSTGSAWSSATGGGAPTGSAGGVLGYTASTYPNPTGLAATVFGAPAEAFLPIKAAVDGVGAWKRTVFRVDANDDPQATSVTLRAGSGASGSWANPTPGGAATVEGGSGSPAFLGGPGGRAGLIGGDATGSNDGGDCDIVPGAGSGTGAKGRIRLFGRLCLSVGNPQTVNNGSRIGSTGLPAVMHPIEHAGAACTLDAAEPIVSLTGGSDGTTITVVNIGSGTVTIPAGGNVMVENAVNVVLAPFQLASFVWITMGPGGMWLQTTPKLQVG